MATVDRYKIKMDVEGERQVKNLDRSMGSLNNSIAGVSAALFKASAIGVGALTALGVGAIKTAKQMSDLAGTAGMTAGQLLHMSRAAEQSGGSFDQLPMMLMRFSDSIDRAAEGADDMRRALSRVGVSTQDLATLDDQELFRRVVQGLGAMEDGAEKTSLSLRLLGRQAATTNLREFGERLNDAVDPAVNDRLEKAAKLVRQMDEAFRILQETVLAAIEPIIDKMLKFNFTAETARKSILILSSAVAALFGAATVLAIIRVISAFRALVAMINAAASAKAFLISLTGVGLALVAGAGLAAAATYKTLSDVLDEATEKQKDLNTEIGNQPTPGAGDSGQTGGTGRDILLSAEDRLRLSVSKTNRELIERTRLNNEHRRQLIAIQGLNAEEATLIRNNLDAERDIRTQVLAVQGQMNDEVAKGAKFNQEVWDLLFERRQFLMDQLEVQKQINQEEFNRAQHLKNMAVQEQISLEMARNRAIEQKNVAEIMLMQQRIAGEITETEMRTSQQLAALQIDHRERIFSLQEQEQRARRANDGAEHRRILSLISLERQRFLMAKDQIAELDKLRQQLEQSYAAGTLAALDQLSQQFTPYQMAQDAIIQGWNTINNAIVNFANTGKLSFRDMARSILRDLALMIVRAQVFQAIMGIGSALNIAGFVGSLFGAPAAAPAGGNGGFGIFGLGGMIPAGKVGLVGDRGPEFIGGPAQITPIRQSDMRSQPTQVNYYIEAIDTQSFQDRLAQDPEFVYGVTQRGSRSFA